MSTAFQPHDLLALRSGGVVRAVDPAEQNAVAECLHMARFAVVRRGVVGRDEVPVGVRGASREERYAGFVAAQDVLAVHPPESLRASEQQADVPALRVLCDLQREWRGAPFAWGPVGSVGFTLATGVRVVHAGSDLDLLLRVTARQNREIAARLQRELRSRQCRVEVQVQLPQGFVALDELASPALQVMLRTADGVELVPHLWPPDREGGLVEQAVSQLSFWAEDKWR